MARARWMLPILLLGPLLGPAHAASPHAAVAACVAGPIDLPALAERTGASAFHAVAGLPGFQVFESAGPADVLASRLAREPGVWRVTPVRSRPRHLRALPDDPLRPLQWHLVNTGQSGGTKGADIDVAPAWAAGLTGNGIRIGFVDDGVESTHPDLAPNARPDLGHDYRDGDDDPSPEGPAGYDNTGEPLADSHGTAVAGIAAASGGNRVGVTGVAYRATIVPIRLIGPDPNSDEQEAGALAHGIGVLDISNNPWGPDDDGQTVEMPGPLAEAALERGTREGRGGLGTVYVWSGGNGGENDDNANNDGYANAMQVIAAGALTDMGQRAPYSEPGACLLVTAPGGGNTAHQDGIVTTDLHGARGYNDGKQAFELGDPDYTQLVEGTSASAPIVSGVVALMLEANPRLGWRDVQEVLLRSARFVVPQDPGWFTNRAGFRFNPSYGAGAVDAAAAVQLGRTWTNLPPASIGTDAWIPASPVAIPDGNASGVTHAFAIAPALRVEHVRLAVDIVHANRGQLAIDLVSPSGTTNHLFLPHVDPNADLAHRFGSVECWGEPSAGTWRARVVDAERGDTGVVRSMRLEVVGTPAGALPRAGLSVDARAAGGPRVTVRGVAGERWRVESSVDLRAWSAVGEADLTSGPEATVTDSDPAAGVAARGYRATRLFP